MMLSGGYDDDKRYVDEHDFPSKKVLDVYGGKWETNLLWNIFQVSPQQDSHNC